MSPNASRQSTGKMTNRSLFALYRVVVEPTSHSPQSRQKIYHFCGGTSSGKSLDKVSPGSQTSEKSLEEGPKSPTKSDNGFGDFLGLFETFFQAAARLLFRDFFSRLFFETFFRDFFPRLFGFGPRDSLSQVHGTSKVAQGCCCLTPQALDRGKSALAKGFFVRSTIFNGIWSLKTCLDYSTITRARLLKHDLLVHSRSIQTLKEVLNMSGSLSGRESGESFEIFLPDIFETLRLENPNLLK